MVVEVADTTIGGTALAISTTAATTATTAVVWWPLYMYLIWGAEYTEELLTLLESRPIFTY